MYCPQPNKTRKAFTLVEVLMVLVIIAIMAGLLITIIDPVRQRGRARDGTIIATATKIVATITAFNSTLGVFPGCSALAGIDGPEIQNAVPDAACNATLSRQGSFAINNIVTPNICNAVGASPASQTGDCTFRYESPAGGARACLMIRLHFPADLDADGVPEEFLYWDSTATNGAITDVNDAAAATTACSTLIP